jgi:hypothetical protein
MRGRDVKISHGLAESLAQLAAEPPQFSGQVIGFLDGLVSHYVLDSGRLVVAHAGLREEMQGRASAAVRAFALYGETTGETDEFGLPVRYPWAQDYRGKAVVVYGHTPVPEAVWVNNTICLDTGCVFGGRLTALRYPERELVSVPAQRVYYQPARPLAAAPAGTGTPGAGAPGAGAPGRGGPAAAPRRGRRHRPTGDRDTAPRPGHHPRAERGRCAGGDEPVRHRPTVADLPAADHAAGARQHPAQAPGTPGGRAWRLPP